MSKQIKKLFIAGWDGFIGSHLVSLARDSSDYSAVDGCGSKDLNLTQTNSWETLSSRMDAQSILVILAGVKRQAGDEFAAYDINNRIALSLARTIESTRPCRVLFFSSAAVYGEETNKTDINESTPVDPISLYGIAKFTSERLLAIAARATGTPLTIVRPPLIYGPGDTTNSYGPVGFCRSFALCEPITLWGDGSELREFLFVQDCCRLVLELLNTPFEGVLNLVSGQSHTFVDALNTVEKVSGRTIRLTHKPRTKPQVNNGFDATLLHAIIPGFPFTSLEDGVRQTYLAESKNSSKLKELAIAPP